MVSVDFSHIFNIGIKHGLTKSQFSAQKKYLSTYLERFHTRDQHFHEVIDDVKSIREIKQFAKEVKGVYEDVVVLGIGGSALGTICLQQSLKHLYEHELRRSGHPRLHVIDNVDPVLIEEIADVINLKKTLFLVISKSGGTPEPISAFLYFSKLVAQKKLSLKKHFVFVTNPHTSILRSIADKEGIRIFEHPTVGGRWAVLTVVGLLPAALVGVKIEQLLKGARSMRDAFLSTTFKHNLPFQLATVQYLLSKKGKNIHVMMPYSQKLIRFADWYRQLLAESTGKEVDRNGKKVHVGLTPVKALGTTDQHSQAQLYNEGPNDKLIMFVTVKKPTRTVRIPRMYPVKELSYLKGASFNTLIQAEQQATSDALRTYKRPNITITIDKVDEFHLGQMFMLFEGATAFLGEYLNIDAYNQPGVELAKVLTRKYLSRKKK